MLTFLIDTVVARHTYKLIVLLHRIAYECAKQLSQQFQAFPSCSVRVVDLAEYEPDDLKEEAYGIFCISTYTGLYMKLSLSFQFLIIINFLQFH